jgi:hypothetical protein
MKSVVGDPVVPLPSDSKPSLSLLEVQILRVTITSQTSGQPVGGIEQPRIAGIGGEQHQRSNGDKAAIVFGGSALDVFDLLGQLKVLAGDGSLPRSTLESLSAHEDLPIR